jgi:hypothetical protein
MRRGRIYTAANLARLLGEKVSTVDEALCELVASGSIEACNQSMHALGYRRAEVHSAQPTQSDSTQPTETSVATFPVTRRLEGSLTGYGASMEQHRALAMLARR